MANKPTHSQNVETIDEEANMTIISRSAIIHALRSNPLAVEKAILILYEGQTADEKVLRGTHHDNRKGFNTAHAKLGSYYAKWILSGKKLTSHHLAKAREIAIYYAGTQLLQAAKEKQKIKRERTQDAILSARISLRDPFQKTVGVAWLNGRG